MYHGRVAGGYLGLLRRFDLRADAVFFFVRTF
jgi:hypothetical protein